VSDATLQQIAAALPRPAGGPDWLQAAREQARGALAGMAVPGRKSEAWRYTPLDGLLKQLLQEPEEVAFRPELPPPLAEGPRLVFVGGRFAAELSDLTALPKGLELRSLGEALAADAGTLPPELGRIDPAHPLRLMNLSSFADGLLIRLAAGATPDAPLEIVHLAVPGSPLHCLRHDLEMGAGSALQIIERYLGADAAAGMVNLEWNVRLGQGASLRQHRHQAEGASTRHLSVVEVVQQRDSNYQALQINQGGSWSRAEYAVRFAGEGAECRINGLMTAGQGQVRDIHLRVDHAAANCTSNELVRAIAWGNGRTVFDGCASVAREAPDSRAHMRNDNLLLSADAEADTKPVLLIETDAVECSHGATVGQLDEQQLFYLRSRGLNEVSARHMLCLGFANQVLSNAVEPLREQVAAFLESHLER